MVSFLERKFLLIGVSSSVVGGAVGGVVLLLVLVLVCGFGTGMIVVYQLRRRKEKRQSGHTYT